MRRRAAGAPRSSDFLAARDYEASTPAAFGLPELPVLYAQLPATLDGRAAEVWIASDALYVCVQDETYTAEVENSLVRGTAIEAGAAAVELGSAALADEAARALQRAGAFNASLGEDDVELAVPLDYESGQADDLGDAHLQHSVGTGMTLASGPAVATKRRRPS